MESSANDIFPSRFLPTGKREIEKKWGKPKRSPNAIMRVD
jgi:hypothetical protein